MKNFTLIISILLCIVCGCIIDKSNTPDQIIEYIFTFDFNDDEEGWIMDFADYPVGEEVFYGLESDRTKLPDNLDQNQYALKLSGNNHSDDLFMFLKKKIIGLKPNTLYKIIFTVEIASQYPENSFGIGGSPGASVYVKVGAINIEPAAVDSNDYYCMNIDKSDQASSGNDMIVIGTVGISGDDFVYTLIQRDNASNPFRVQSDPNGDIWVIIGTDSGFEGITTLYYNTIHIQVIEQ